MHRLSQCAIRQSHARLGSPLRISLLTIYTQPQKPFTTGFQVLRSHEDHSKRKARWYERLLGLQDSDEVVVKDAEGEEEAWDLKRRISELEEELKEIQSGRSLALLSPEDQAKVRRAREEEAQAKSTGSGEQYPITPDNQELGHENDPIDLGEEAEYVPNLNDLDITFNLREDQIKHLRSLNYAVRAAAVNPSGQRTRQALWKRYARCKHSIPQLFHQIPNGAWDILWESQSRASASEKDRTKNLLTLLEDMERSGRDLSPLQRLTLLESLLNEGHYRKAREKWISAPRTLRDNQDTRQRFQDLGVRILASCSGPQEAQDLALSFLSGINEPRARILIPVIEAWLRYTDDSSIRSAWALYLNLRLRLAAIATISDYDAIMMAFLNAGRADLALAVFKDLMIGKKESQYDSTSLYTAAIGKLDAPKIPNVNQSLSTASLTALTLLPRKYQNKFFYGSWLKRLLGLGQITAASAVLELMYERGVRPEPKHLNGIIGAYLRGGNLRDKDKAIQMGWAMIQERLEFVAKRRLSIGNGNAPEVSVSPHQDLPIPYRLQRIVPPATIETFSLLLLYYERRSMPSYVQHLQECLEKAEIPPNSFFMNHILYAELRQGNLNKIWKIYKTMTQHIKPDLETYACLWDCEKAHLDKLDSYASDRFPNPREMFAEMINWFSKLSDKGRNTARDEFSKEMYNQIIRCFCLARDLEGSIVALYSLRSSFAMYPDLDTVRMLTLQVARSAQERQKPKGRRRPRLLEDPRSKANVNNAMRILEVVAEERENALEGQKIVLNSLSEDAQAEEHLYRIAEFLRVVLSRAGPQVPDGEEGADKVAWEMGVGGIDMQCPAYPAKSDSEGP